MKALRDSLNPGVSEDDAIEMIASFEITQPIFDVLFASPEVVRNNPVSAGMARIIDELHKVGLSDSTRDPQLRDLYSQVRVQASQITTDSARQTLIKDFYNDFFKDAFPDTSDKMGIVYTPVEIVDAQLHMVERALQKDFGLGLADDGVHVLDGFAGTGTYICRLIESPELIPDDTLPHKYTSELHSNEIVPMAAAIMSINCEESYHSRMGGNYISFPGALLADTFQMSEDDNTIDDAIFTENSERMRAQMKAPIRVIIGNPPYKGKQDNANDDNKNQSYISLDARIATTYAANTKVTNKNALYDPYVRAFRWASDRIEETGIVCFVSNAGWLRAAAMSGMRECLVDEFDDIYVYDLRGNQRTKGEESRREGGKVFGSGSRAAIAITMLVRKNAGIKHQATVHYFDVGDYKTRDEKLEAVKGLVEADPQWEIITPDIHGDWFNRRDDSFNQFMPLGIENRIGKEPNGIFNCYSRGFETDRDPWVWNFSYKQVQANVSRLIEDTNNEMDAVAVKERPLNMDIKKYTWTRSFKNRASKKEHLEYNPKTIMTGLYRPFCKQKIYSGPALADYPGQQPKFFPYEMNDLNKVIMVPSKSNSGFSCLISDVIPDLNSMNAGAQCFPMYYYETPKNDNSNQMSLFDEDESNSKPYYKRHDAITDEALEVFRSVYPYAYGATLKKNDGRSKQEGGPVITKEDIFYYIYGVLHSPEYRERFASNLQKELPCIPLVGDFIPFAECGRILAELHCNYESVEPWIDIVEDGDSANPGRTTKITFGKCTKTEENPKGIDRTVLHVAEHMTLRNIPEGAYSYIVNGRSAIEWIMDRYQVRTDKRTGIINDCNDWSTDPRYITELVESVVTVSMRTLEEIEKLPPLNERKQSENWPIAWK